MRKLTILIMSVVIVLGMFGCSNPTGKEVMTTCVMAAESETEIEYRIFHTDKVATKMETISKIDFPLDLAEDLEKLLTALNKETFGESVVTSFNMIDGENYISIVYDLLHSDAYLVFEYYALFDGVDVKNKDGSYSSKKILNAIKNFEEYKFTCKDKIIDNY